MSENGFCDGENHLSSESFNNKVQEKIGTVAYQLALPPKSRIHPVFHVSQLKKKLGANIIPAPLLPLVDQQGNFRAEPTKILACRLVPRYNRAVTQLLVQWSNSTPSEATWEDLDHLRAMFPTFHP